MKLIKSAWEIIKNNRRSYIVLNVVYYGLVVVFMVYAAFNPDIQKALMDAVGATFMTGPLSFIGKAYANAEVLRAILVTFVINLFVGSFGSITLPSLIIPFSGLLVGIYRAAMWGLILSPASPDLRLVMIPHSITLLIEGQAYILTMLAAYIQGRSFLWPRTLGFTSHRKGYVEGVKRSARLYVLVISALVVAAVYEVIEVVLMIKIAP
jgi:hypothetical protein